MILCPKYEGFSKKISTNNENYVPKYLYMRVSWICERFTAVSCETIAFCCFSKVKIEKIILFKNCIPKLYLKISFLRFLNFAKLRIEIKESVSSKNSQTIVGFRSPETQIFEIFNDF